MVDTFPIMESDKFKSVPWSLAERIRKQAHFNHSQTLERLAERGGLSPLEFVGAARGLSWSGLTPLLKSGEDMDAALSELCEAHHGER